MIYHYREKQFYGDRIFFYGINKCYMMLVQLKLMDDILKIQFLYSILQKHLLFYDQTTMALWTEIKQYICFGLYVSDLNTY